MAAEGDIAVGLGTGDDDTPTITTRSAGAAAITSTTSVPRTARKSARAPTTGPAGSRPSTRRTSPVTRSIASCGLWCGNSYERGRFQRVSPAERVERSRRLSAPAHLDTTRLAAHRSRDRALTRPGPS